MTSVLEQPTKASTALSDTGAKRRQQSEEPKLERVSGILDVQDQHGFLRVDGYLPGPRDLYVPPAMIRRHDLRPGDLVEGTASQGPAPSDAGSRPAKAHPLVGVDRVNGVAADGLPARPRFAGLVPLHPQERLRLETDPGVPGTRIIDLLAPIGKGQRGLIVAPPKTGKTLILKAIAAAVRRNNPECHLMVVLVDERPEEVTDMRRSVDGEIVASTFDRPAHEHIAAAELALERAKRLAELGTDVVVLLDSVTRLCRAHNNNAKSGGRILSGGVDAAAVAGPKKLFGAARNLEGAGSVTLIATALIDTGSRADDYYFEELKSTGNMELRLDRALADKRVFPAVDVAGSGTRRDELLMSAEELDAVGRLRRVLSAQTNSQAVELLLERMKQTGSNAEFLYRLVQTAPAA
jgi:transcription termination factor Rho